MGIDFLSTKKDLSLDLGTVEVLIEGRRPTCPNNTASETRVGRDSGVEKADCDHTQLREIGFGNGTYKVVAML